MEGEETQRRNGRTALRLGLVGAAMFGLGFLAVPFYGLICEVAGLQTARASLAPARVPVAVAGERRVTVKFDVTVQPNLPWRVEPAAPVEIKLGENRRVVFRASNRSGDAVDGQAVFALAPWQANSHFSKAQCFCFERQRLEAGEEKEMPLVFMVSPDLPAGIDSLTLSYTFMNLDAATRAH